jgi:chorismate dehydratase
VLSVKLLFRVAPERVRTLALDEGSRTSAVLAQILLFQLHGVRPQLTSLPIGESPAGVAADAVLVIGDRAMRDDLPAGGENGQHAGGKRQASGEVSQPPFCQVWDLGEQWTAWSQLPFVFAMWIARPGVPRAEVASALSAARDAGEQQLPEIARQQAAALQLPEPLVHDYLSRNLHFHLDKKQRQGLELFYRQAAVFGLVAAVPQVDFDDCPTESC